MPEELSHQPLMTIIQEALMLHRKEQFHTAIRRDIAEAKMIGTGERSELRVKVDTGSEILTWRIAKDGIDLVDREPYELR